MKFNPTLKELYPVLAERAKNNEESAQCRLGNFTEFRAIKKDYKYMVAMKKAYWKGFEDARRIAILNGTAPSVFSSNRDVRTFYSTMSFLAKEIATYRCMLDEFKAYCKAGYRKVIRIDKYHVRESEYEKQDFRYLKTNLLTSN